MLNDLYFKTTCNIRPHFLGPMGGLKIEGPLYIYGSEDVRKNLHIKKRATGSMKVSPVQCHFGHC